jgi:ATP adenylyltransferase
MPYIERSKKDDEPGCLFCNKIGEEDDEANLVVYRGRQSLVMLNLFPYNSGHLMVAPYQHTGSVAELRPEAAQDLVAMTQMAVRVLEEVMRPDGLNLGINQGKVAGAGVVDHIHLHIVPRWDGDTNFMPVLANTKVIPEALSATAAKLRPVFARLHPPE